MHPSEPDVIAESVDRTGPGVPGQAATLIVAHAAQLLTIRPRGQPRRGGELRELDIIPDGAVALRQSKILALGPSDEILKQVEREDTCQVIDATGRVVTPGLVDPHTHPVYAGNRAAEFEMRIEGRSYEEIAAAGGGIRSTVRATRSAKPAALRRGTRQRLLRMLAMGTTTAEVKSGYGLTTESELDQLRTIAELADELPLELVPTFLGAHEIPDEYRERREQYIELIVHEMLPRVAEERLARFSDVFCDRGVYSIDETRYIQQSARRAGLGLKLHADELASTGGAQLAAELGATSADHLIRIDDQGVRALAQSPTLAVLLPGTSFSLGARHFAPARELIDRGAAIALATDCNAGSCNTESLTMAAALAAQFYGLTAAECWTALTYNAAWALELGDRLGSLAPGYQADLVLWDMEDYRELPFHFGVNLARTVIKKGHVVARHGTVPDA